MRSVRVQSYPHWKAVFINDGSTDEGKTQRELLAQVAKHPQMIVENHSINAGAAKRRFDAIKKYSTSENDVILLLGMDDSLLGNCLDYIKREYDNGNWMTYGNWVDNINEMLPPGFLIFQDATHKNRDYRKVNYRSTAPNTFKRFLFDQLTEDDFKQDGQWFKQTTESNLMLSCLEMCGKEKIGVIERPIYLYNKRGKFNTKNRLGRIEQQELYKKISLRPKKQLLIRESSPLLL